METGSLTRDLLAWIATTPRVADGLVRIRAAGVELTAQGEAALRARP